MRFRRNPRADAELRRQIAHRRALEGAARDAKSKAEAIARSLGGTGDTARRFEVVVEGDEVRLVNTDPFFHLTEFGSVNNPPFAPLRRGVRAAGLDLQEHPK